MVALTVMYPAAHGTTFDWNYYLAKHAELSRRLLTPLGLRRLEIARGAGGFPPGAPAPYHAIAHLYFDSAESLQSAMMSAAPELIADVPNYYNRESVVQISEIVVS